MNRIAAFLLTTSALLLSAPHAKAASCTTTASNIVLNCGFETGSFSSWTLKGNDVPGASGNLYGVEFGADPYPLPGGTAPSSGDYQAYFSDQAADPITLSQSLATLVGSTYTISFELAQAFVGPGTVKNSAVVSFGGTNLVTLTNLGDSPYTFYSYTGVATSAASNLSFIFGNDVGEFLLDDVTVTANPTVVATPEPSSWVLTITGMLLMGLLSYSSAKQKNHWAARS